jgi:hypothetical protein
MADNPSNRGPEDSRRVNVHQDYELRYWTEKFGVSDARLKEAVAKVGVSAEAVARELAAGSSRRHSA